MYFRVKQKYEQSIFIYSRNLREGRGFMKKASFILLAGAFAFLAPSALAKYDSPQEREETHAEIRALKQQIKDLPSCNADPSSALCKTQKDALKDQIHDIRASAHQ